MRPAALVSAFWLVWITIAKASALDIVSFLESRPGFYLRHASSNSLKDGTFSSDDVAAAVSVLLGSAPPSSISDESAAKLNELLVPNPFNRPRAVLILSLKHDKPGSFQATVSEQRGSAGIVAQQRHLQVEATTSPLVISEDVSLLFLNTTDKVALKSTLVNRELHELASFLGGSYEETKEPSEGLVSFLLSNGDVVTLDLKKEVHRAFALKLSSLFHHVQDVASGIDKISGGLIVGTLSAPRDLYEAPESSFTSREASEFLHLVVTKVFAHLDRALNGGLVGVVVNSENEVLALEVKSGPSRLELLQTFSSTTSTVSEVLTESIIAYITGILLIVALIIGVCFLSKMPLTRDTLLYSNVKLD